MRMSTLSREEFLEAVERRRHSKYSPPESGRVNTLKHSLFAENKARSAGSAVLVCFVRAFQKHSASEPNNGKQQLHVLLTQRTLTLRAHPGSAAILFKIGAIKKFSITSFQKDAKLFYPITNSRTFSPSLRVVLCRFAIQNNLNRLVASSRFKTHLNFSGLLSGLFSEPPKRKV